MAIESTIKKRIEESFARQKLMVFYGGNISVEAAGLVTVRVPVKDFLLRTSGIFHGGVIAATADTAAGYAAVSCEALDANFLTVEFKINFLSKAKGGELIAKASVVKHGRTLTVVCVEVFVLAANAEKKIAIALVTLIKENN